MIDYFSYLLYEKLKFKKEYLQLRLYDDQHQSHLEVFVTVRISNFSKQLTMRRHFFGVSCELSQPMGKTEFSSDTKNRPLSHTM